jgi:hypothetical protein
LFSACRGCGCLTFGHAAPGCRACGSDALDAIARPGHGRLLRCVDVEAEIVPGLQVPQAIGEVELAPGVIDEVLLVGSAAQYQAGSLVRARAIVLAADTFECWFEGVPA